MSWNDRIIEEFRANDGVVGGHFEGRDLLLLHHVGRRTGTARVSPLTYQRVDGGYAIFASKGGADEHPAWFHNVVANPGVEIEVGTERSAVRARVANGAERTEIWEAQKAAWHVFAEYERKTDREIPVIVLEDA